MTELDKLSEELRRGSAAAVKQAVRMAEKGQEETSALLAKQKADALNAQAEALNASVNWTLEGIKLTTELVAQMCLGDQDDEDVRNAGIQVAFLMVVRIMNHWGINPGVQEAPVAKPAGPAN